MSSKDIENLLRERLGTTSGRPLPSPDFESRVRRSLTPQVRSRRRAHALEGLVAIAAVLALAVVMLPWLISPRAGVSGGGNTASPSTMIEPTPIPLAHAQKWFLSFDYPTDWTVTDRNITAATSGLNSGSETQGNPSVFGFVGNGVASEECVPNPPVKTYACTSTWSLAAGTVAIRFEIAPRWPYEPNSAWTGQRAVHGPEIPGAEALMIDGLPARFAKSTTDVIPYSSETSAGGTTEETIPGATEVLWWGLTSQQQFQFGYSIVAGIRGPNVAELEAQAKALVAGIHYVPETAMLPTDPAALDQVRQAALEKAFADHSKFVDVEHTHSWDCFPRTVGASQKATITQTLTTNPLTQPLPVTCTVESMVPTVMQGWKLTLRQSWDAGSDYAAGTATEIVVMGGNGQIWESGSSGTLERPAYPHQGGSKIPG